MNCKPDSPLALAGALLSIALVGVLSKAEAQTDLPQGPGRAVVERMCTSCHGLNVVTAQRMTRKAWASQVDDMVSRGAIGSTEDIRQVVDYLAANFGKGQPEKSEPIAASVQESVPQSSGPRAIRNPGRRRCNRWCYL